MRKFIIQVITGLVLLVPNAASASIPLYTKAEVCERAEIVMIGKVTGRTSSVVQYAFGELIMSTVTLSVERMIQGPSLSSITIYVPGGESGGLQQLHNGMAVMKVDERYFLLLHPRTGAPATILGTGRGALRLDPDVTLQSLSQLQAIHAEQCDE